MRRTATGSGRDCASGGNYIIAAAIDIKQKTNGSIKVMVC